MEKYMESSWSSGAVFCHLASSYFKSYHTLQQFQAIRNMFIEWILQVLASQTIKQFSG